MNARISSCFAFTSIVFAFACVGLTGCDPGVQSDVQESDVMTQLVVVGSSTLAQLPEGELFTLDLTQEDVLYRVHVADPELDLSRLEVIEPNGEAVYFDESIEDETNVRGIKLHAVEWASITGNPETFGTLDAEQIEALEYEGVLTTQQGEEFGTIEAALKGSVEVYWTTKKGAFRCIKIGASTGSSGAALMDVQMQGK